MATALAAPAAPPPDLKANLRSALIRAVIVPLLTLIFFLVAPPWLNSKLHSQIAEGIQKSTTLPVAEKSRRLAFFEKLDFAQLTFACPPELEPVRKQLADAGLLTDFERLRWGRWLALTLNAILFGVIGATVLLNRLARHSPDALIRHYRTSWQLGMVAAFAQIFLLIPLLTYGLFEATVLAVDRFFPQLLLALAIGGVIALWKTAAILLKNVPLEFEEPMARAVTPDEAPELWAAVRDAAARLQTAPPDHIIIGMQMNFYVTELAVKHALGRVAGRTLFLSQPLLKQLSPDEVLAIIGHELGHFIGAETRLTREFYPFRHKVHATMLTLAQSGLTGWTSLQSLNFFSWCFGATEQENSRQRELLADRKAAELTSPEITARALVKFHIVNEAFQFGFAEALRQKTGNPLDLPLPALIRDQLLPKDSFWSELFEKKSPHPLDSHPALHVRLASLAQPIGAEEAKAIAVAETENAFARWFTGRDELFSEINRQAEAVASELRTRVQVVEADTKSEAGRQLLESHFPEQRFRGRPTPLILIGAITAIIVIGLLFGAINVDDLTARVICALGIAACIAFTVWLRRRHHHATLILTAEGLSYTGWVRPLSFEDVATMTAQKDNFSHTLNFTLKTRQPPYWKYALLRYPRKTVSLSLGWIDAKQPELMQIIFRYLTRQLEK
jgi:Zn-dependent protease with chaperone function